MYKKKLIFFYTLLIWIAIIVGILVNFFAHDIIYLLYGENYLKSVNVLIIHIWSGIFVSFGSMLSNDFLIRNKIKILLYFDISSTIINIALNYILIPKIGIIGAGIATGISMPITYLLYGLFSSKLRFIIIDFLRSLFLIEVIKHAFFKKN